ncbi:cupin domain-containing protein [Rhodoferax sp.]|uniref:cupin domain-containing protein n=1 Tax=Rhodoferax sp. TaxID=50421 RepID=UPI002605899D|nr:cupin domain-containing protein [Rhodoferax sp.]MDD2926988.1 cupin domain-containing protein [Rhodoferax sp.]
MNKINLPLLAEHLPVAWHSSILGQAAGANIKVLRMDGAAYPSEVHDFDEALLVISGVMQLEVAGAVISVQAGELVIVPAGQAHAVAPGSYGSLVIVDQ